MQLAALFIMKNLLRRFQNMCSDDERGGKGGKGGAIGGISGKGVTLEFPPPYGLPTCECELNFLLIEEFNWIAVHSPVALQIYAKTFAFQRNKG